MGTFLDTTGCVPFRVHAAEIRDILKIRNGQVAPYLGGELELPAHDGGQVVADLRRHVPERIKKEKRPGVEIGGADTHAAG